MDLELPQELHLSVDDDEKFQLSWMLKHPVFDKDRELAEAEEARDPQLGTKPRGKKQRRSPAAWELPLPEQEIDLHGYTAEEAAAAIEDMMEAMQRAGMSVLRVIHGGGNPAYGNVKKIIDRRVRSVWKGRVLLYKTEPDNAGSSIMKFAMPRPK